MLALLRALPLLLVVPAAQAGFLNPVGDAEMVGAIGAAAAAKVESDASADSGIQAVAATEMQVAKSRAVGAGAKLEANGISAAEGEAARATETQAAKTEAVGDAPADMTLAEGGLDDAEAAAYLAKVLGTPAPDAETALAGKADVTEASAAEALNIEADMEAAESFEMFANLPDCLAEDGGSHWVKVNWELDEEKLQEFDDLLHYLRNYTSGGEALALGMNLIGGAFCDALEQVKEDTDLILKPIRVLEACKHFKSKKCGETVSGILEENFAGTLAAALGPLAPLQEILQETFGSPRVFTEEIAKLIVPYEAAFYQNVMPDDALSRFESKELQAGLHAVLNGFKHGVMRKLFQTSCEDIIAAVKSKDVRAGTDDVNVRSSSSHDWSPADKTFFLKLMMFPLIFGLCLCLCVRK
eukprot:TRINITY_DN8472_c0_g1_i2.p1 TRINITY_DN8472_c0_g1~~TRINITY_DN8472_c0_g1_i2.p1  ORF type:complete len:413 (+),score=71.37 TRINITY_DN8472_c0_g1_i2:142-1380(+)